MQTSRAIYKLFQLLTFWNLTEILQNELFLGLLKFLIHDTT